MLGEAAALAAAACWAVGSHLFGRIGRSGEVPPGAMNLGKCITAGALSGLTMFLLTGRALPALPEGALGWLLASGVCGLALGDGCYFGAIVTIGVRRAILLLSTAPVFAAAGGAVFLDERLGLRELAATAAVLAGVALVVYERTGGADVGATSPDRPLGPAAAGPPPLGVLLGVGAGLGQAAGSLMSRAAMAREVSALEASFVRLCAGVAGIVVLAAASGRLGEYARVLRRRPTAGRVAASSIIGTYVGIWLAQFALGHASSTAVASTLLATTPIFALPLGRWLAREPITPRAIGGTLVACAGLMVLTLTAP